MPTTLRCLALVGIAVVGSVGLLRFAHSQEAKSQPKGAVTVKAPADDKAGLKRLAPDSEVWVDSKNKHVIVDGEVCLNKGYLEMFACPKDTKEHESIVSVHGKAYVVHAGLLAVGAKAGGAVQFDPQYVPARGTRIDIVCFWTDENGKKRQAPAQQWIRDVKTKKPMSYHWVFAGSGFWLDENTGKRHYLGDAGDFICVSNFPSATMDLPIKSSDDNDNLLFEALTENIPPRGTKVTLVLVPRLEQDTEKKSTKAAQKTDKKRKT
jgi:hypothetical protein